jgi:hypothetical protein
MPVETLQETIARHSEHGGYVPLDNGKFLFGDGAVMQGIPGHGSSIQEPPREEIFRLAAVLEYWRRRTALAIDIFNQFKKQLQAS